MLATIIVLVISLLVYVSTKIRIDQNKKPTIPEGLSEDLQIAQSQIESAYPDNLDFITNIIRGKIQQTGTNKMVKMHFADGFKYVLLIPQNVYCVERIYAEDDDEESDGCILLELYSEWGNLLSYSTASSSSHSSSPFRSMPFLFNLLPAGYSFEPSKEPSDLLHKY